MEAMNTNQSIVYLDLNHNGIDNTGGHYIAEMLKNNFTLHGLNLENNSLGDDFIESL